MKGSDDHAAALAALSAKVFVWPGFVVLGVVFASARPLPGAVADQSLTGPVTMEEADATIPWRHAFTIREPRRELGDEGQIGDVAVGPDGTVYVVEQQNRRVQMVSADLSTSLGVFGCCGHEEGQFRTLVERVLVGPEGHVYVQDEHIQGGRGGTLGLWNPILSRIQLFDRSGHFLGSRWIDGRIEAIASDGSMWGIHSRWESAVRSHVTSILRYPPDGGPAQRWPAPEGIEFDLDDSIAVGRDGHVYIAKYGAGTIAHLTPAMRLAHRWSVDGNPFDIVADDDGTVLVSIGGHTLESRGRIERFAPDGASIEVLVRDVGIDQPVRFGVGPDGGLVYRPLVRWSVSRVVDGRTTTWGGPNSEMPWSWGNVACPAIDGGVHLIVHDEGLKLRTFDHLGKPADVVDLASMFSERWFEVRTCGEVSEGVLRTMLGTGAVVDFMIREGTSEIAWTLPADVVDRVRFESSSRFTPDGSLIVAWSDPPTVRRYDPDGALAREWIGSRDSEAAFENQVWVAASPLGQRIAYAHRVEIAGRDYPDGVATRVTILSPTLEVLDSWHVETAFADRGPADFVWNRVSPRAADLAISDEGVLFGALAFEENGADQVWAFSPTGSLISQFPDELSEGETIVSIHYTADGRLYLADAIDDNVYQIRAFSPERIPGWRLVEYADTELLGPPSDVRWIDEDRVALEWPDTSTEREPGIGRSARLESRAVFETGVYEFNLVAAGGLRLWIGDSLVLDRWKAERVDLTFERIVHGSERQVLIEYSDRDGTAALNAGWSLVAPAYSIVLPHAVAGGS